VTADPRRRARRSGRWRSRFGLSAESRAAAYLIAKGHRIVARRWRSPVGEIDIVARRRRTLIFCRGEGARKARRRRGGSPSRGQTAPHHLCRQGVAASHPEMQTANIRFDVCWCTESLPRHIVAASRRKRLAASPLRRRLRDPGLALQDGVPDPQ
jgi:putative endonuclease